jgi:hypothetical protein
MTKPKQKGLIALPWVELTYSFHHLNGTHHLFCPWQQARPGQAKTATTDLAAHFGQSHPFMPKSGPKIWQNRQPKPATQPTRVHPKFLSPRAQQRPPRRGPPRFPICPRPPLPLRSPPLPAPPPAPPGGRRRGIFAPGGRRGGGGAGAGGEAAEAVRVQPALVPPRAGGREALRAVRHRQGRRGECRVVSCRTVPRCVPLREACI